MGTENGGTVLDAQGLAIVRRHFIARAEAAEPVTSDGVANVFATLDRALQHLDSFGITLHDPVMARAASTGSVIVGEMRPQDAETIRRLEDHVLQTKQRLAILVHGETVPVGTSIESMVDSIAHMLRQRSGAIDQIDKLAAFITEETDEPRENEGAGVTAVRIIRQATKDLAEAKQQQADAVDMDEALGLIANVLGMPGGDRTPRAIARETHAAIEKGKADRKQRDEALMEMEKGAEALQEQAQRADSMSGELRNVADALGFDGDKFLPGSGSIARQAVAYESQNQKRLEGLEIKADKMAYLERKGRFLRAAVDSMYTACGLKPEDIEGVAHKLATTAEAGSDAPISRPVVDVLEQLAIEAQQYRDLERVLRGKLGAEERQEFEQLVEAVSNLGNVDPADAGRLIALRGSIAHQLGWTDVRPEDDDTDEQLTMQIGVIITALGALRHGLSKALAWSAKAVPVESVVGDGDIISAVQELVAKVNPRLSPDQVFSAIDNLRVRLKAALEFAGEVSDDKLIGEASALRRLSNIVQAGSRPKVDELPGGGVTVDAEEQLRLHRRTIDGKNRQIESYRQAIHSMTVTVQALLA